MKSGCTFLVPANDVGFARFGPFPEGTLLRGLNLAAVSSDAADRFFSLVAASYRGPPELNQNGMTGGESFFERPFVTSPVLYSMPAIYLPHGPFMRVDVNALFDRARFVGIVGFGIGCAGSTYVQISLDLVFPGGAMPSSFKV